MRERHSSGLKYMDWLIFSLFLALVGIGWTMILSVGADDEVFTNFFARPAGKQTIWIGICGVAFLLIFSINARFWFRSSWFIYGLALAMLVGVLVFGTTIKGARSWFVLGGFSIQPSELAKFGTALAFGAFLGKYKAQLKQWNNVFAAFAIMLVPTALILLQPDAGSALVFMSFSIVLYRAGLSGWLYAFVFFSIGAVLAGLIVENVPVILLALLLIGMLVMAYQLPQKVYALLAVVILAIGAAFLTSAGYGQVVLWTIGGVFALLSTSMYRAKKFPLAMLLSGAILWATALSFVSQYAFTHILKPHQQDRINVWLHPDRCSPRGSLYNLLQSKTAIGSGGLTGKGAFQGTMTKLKHVPEQSTDFIFCTVGEEHGFVGSMVVILLFVFLLIRIVILAERQRWPFARYYAYGIAGILFFHFFINIGMTMGVVPIIGIPLPFLSKGGSSLLGFTIMLAVLLKLDSKRFQLS